MKKFLVLVILVSLSLPLFASAGREAAPTTGDWVPTRQIDMVVPYAAGGSTDLLARAVERIWPKYSPQPMRVVNRAGGGGVTGSVFVSNSAPDGYTLVMGYGSGCDMSMPHLQQLDYDPFAALTPISLISIHTVMVAVPADSQFRNLSDIMEWTRRSGQPATFASSTANGTIDLTLQAFAKRSGANVIIVPTDGSAVAMTMLMGGQTMAAGAHPSDVLPQYKGGRIRLVGVAADVRDTAMPDVPTFREQGIPFHAYGSIKGVAGPKNLPQNIIRYYDGVFKKICEDPEFIQIMTDMAQPVIYKNPTDFAAFFRPFKYKAGFVYCFEDLQHC